MKWTGGLNPYRLGADVKFNPGFNTGLGEPGFGDGDGVTWQTRAVTQDTSGNFYVADFNRYRILKYSSAGVFLGWIGRIASSPTGGAAGCNGAAAGTTTPGWCTGGIGKSGTGDGMFTRPIDLATDSSGNIYVLDISRVMKFNSSGVFQGWIGNISTSPTGGAAGCNGAASGTATPGWCTGGTSSGGSGGDAAMPGPTGLALDASGNIYVSDYGNNRILKFDSSGVFQGWIGKIGTSPTGGAAGCSGAAVGSVTPGWCTGGKAASGNGDGMMATPGDVAIDSGGSIYVADANHRLLKFNSSGVFQGWTGKVLTSPTGGAAGCNGAAVGSVTPGWCTGGTSSFGTGVSGLFTPQGISIAASGNIYLYSNPGGMIKIASSGVLQGWIGKIGTSPTGGAAGCNGAAVGTLTPGWCSGGAPAGGTGEGMLGSQVGSWVDASENLYVADSNNRITKYNSSGVYQGSLQSTTTFQSWHRSTNLPALGFGDGMMSGPYGIALDSSGNILAADFDNNRILKFNSAGTFQGWLGAIDTSPTGGAAGCNGAAVGTATPGWCTGGTSDSGSDDGTFTSVYDVAVDISGSFYATDYYNGRVVKYNSAGVFQGWIGKVGGSPTGGAAGCSGAAFNSITPGWCKGGYSNPANSSGGFNAPSGIALDPSGNFFYVADSGSNRLIKYNSSGVLQGWVGKIATSPTGGAAGCSGATVGTITPGWCKGGTAAGGSVDGAFSYPTDVTVDSSGNVYVVDNLNYRISKYNSSGVFQGWIGAIGTSPTGGAAGCNGATVGTATPGWCTGGTAASGIIDGTFSYPIALTVDPNGNLYVSDIGEIRISKFNSSGVFQGWIGPIGTTPTGGAAGCKAAATNIVTPGWCKGGRPLSGGIPGEFQCPVSIAWSKNGDLIVGDCSYSIYRYSIQGR